MKLESINYKIIIARPELLARIVSIDENSDTCFQEMDRLIRSDKGTVSFILRVANSVMYSRGKRIKTIPHAITLLGIKIIRSLAMLSSSRAIFSQYKDKLFHRHVWQHSLLTALACHRICHEMNEPRLAEEAFVAGLLHDIGKVLLYSNCPEEYPNILKYVLEQPCSCWEAEQKFLEINHNDVGKQAVLEWNLPEHFVDYIGVNLESALQHKTGGKVVFFLTIANNLIKNAGYGSRELEISERRTKLLNTGASDELIDRLLDEGFLQELMQSELYRFSLKK